MLKPDFEEAKSVIPDPRPEDIAHAGLSELLVLWHGWGGKDEAPARRHFTPHDIKSFLPKVVLLDVEDSGTRFKHRVVGTDVAEAAGGDLTGQYWEESPDKAFAFAGFRMVVESGVPLYARIHDKIWNNEFVPKYDVLVCPLFGNDGRVEMLLLVFAF